MTIMGSNTVKTYHFTTNIRCGACQAKVAAAFAEEPRITDYRVDLTDPSRPLDVTVSDLSREAVIKRIAEAGYEAKPKGGLASLFGK